jgi:peptidoglycan/xylan/chitin deacetylase (PgdA/CDA1 family)
MADRLVVLTYHRVLENRDPLRAGEADLEMFTQQIESTARWFNVLPLREAAQRWQQATLPPRAVAITFDDGYRDNFELARPVLEKAGVSATFFIATGFLDGGCMWNDIVIDALARTRLHAFDGADYGVGRLELASPESRAAAVRDLLAKLKYLELEARVQRARELAARLEVTPPTDLMMTSEQVRSLAQRGFEVGAHTVNHPILSSLPAEKARGEIAGSKRVLEDLTGGEVALFAYPNGRPGDDYGERECNITRDAGFLAAFSTRAAVVDRTAKAFELPRVAPWDRSGLKHAARVLRAAWLGKI